MKAKNLLVRNSEIEWYGELLDTSGHLTMCHCDDVIVHGTSFCIHLLVSS
jgi:hypothetical protein